MSLWDDAWRGTVAFATGGASEAYRAIKNELDTGKEEREAAQQLDAEGKKLWTDLKGGVPASGEMQLSYGREGDIKPYDPGPMFIPFEQQALDAGNSAYQDMQVDPRARTQMEGASDYFADVMKNPIDAMADADYARRQKQAEMQRRASADAALANLEARGQGNSGANLTAALNSSSGQISDQYQAGLDTNAVAQARRDSAATAYGQAGQHIGDLQARVDQNKATGQDAWKKWDVDNRYDVQKYNTDAWNTSGTDFQRRRNSVDDANIATQNATTTWNRIGAPEQAFQNNMAVTAGATGQYAQSAAGMRSDAQNAFNPITDVIIPIGSNIAKAGA